MRRLLLLGLIALLPACAIEIDDDPEESSDEVGASSTGLAEGESTPLPSTAPEPSTTPTPELTSVESGDPGGPTPDPWAAGDPDGPTPDPWVAPVQKKTAH